MDSLWNMTTATLVPLDGSEQASSNFLRLPHHIRRRIYLHVGLASWDGRPYRFDLHRRQASPEPPESGNFAQTPSPGDFWGLLLSCRTIYTEAATLLYSSNLFAFHYSRPGSFEPLRNLTVLSLASLTRLKIVLNESSCHAPQDGVYPQHCCLYNREKDDYSGAAYCRALHSNLHRPPLCSSASGNDVGKLAARVMLSEWHWTTAHMASHIGSGRLELSLVCDIDDKNEERLEMGKLAVAPLLLLPPLKDCHVRLGKTPEHQLRQIAQDAALQARRLDAPYSNPASTSSATLIDLPREVRLRILQYTDLITPWKEVTWSRQHRGYIVYPPLQCEDDNKRPDRPHDLVHHGCQFRQCCSPKPDPAPSVGCFCRRRHAAFSSTCKCWAPPGPDLFLVCRALCREAQFVFFSGNRFIVHDFDSDAPYRAPPPPLQAGRTNDLLETLAGFYPFPRFAASQFLRDVVPTRCLADLRFLELVFPPYPHQGWPGAGHAAMRDWWRTVGWMRDKIAAPALTLRVVMADTDACSPAADRAAMAVGQGTAVAQGYDRILAPLQLLAAGDDGLGGFYARLAFPLRWNEAAVARMEQDEDEAAAWIVSEERVLKDRAERFVLGDRYESLSPLFNPAAPTEPQQSIWRLYLYHGCLNPRDRAA
ncbi:hypothetical protein VTK56DRAFT_506 [Thermocarpiscus australiensis]